MISLLTDQKVLYRPGAFGGAAIDDPWKIARDYTARLRDQNRSGGPVDLVLPLCHLYEPQDEKVLWEQAL